MWKFFVQDSLKGIFFPWLLFGPDMRNSFLYNSLGRNISSMLRECPLGSLSYSEHASSVKNNTCLFLWVSLSLLPGFVCYRKSWCLFQFFFLSGLRVVPAIRSAGDNFNQDVWSFIGIHVKKFKPLLGLTWMTNTEIWAAYCHTKYKANCWLLPV